jgi:ribosome maturation factor RimP
MGICCVCTVTAHVRISLPSVIARTGFKGGTFVPKERVTDIVEKLAQPIVDEAGLELVDVEYKKEGANWYLRVFIDKPEGVDIDDCSRVSERLSETLDEVDPIQDSYFLEVSSPGAERPLKKPSDYERAVGEHIHVSLYEPLGDQKSFEGEMTGYDGTQLELVYHVKGVKKTISIPIEKVASARLAIHF